jgi:hypothetical protein
LQGYRDPSPIEREDTVKVIHQSTITHLQEVYFDVCDRLNGDSAKSLGYKNQNEMFSEFKRKLEAVEQDLRFIFGDLEPNPQ